MGQPPTIILITGMIAAGKSSVAQALAVRLDPSVHLRGDVYRRMIVNGRAEMSKAPSEEALRQLTLRYRLSCQAAKGYWQAGFNVVYQDVVIGPALGEVVETFRDLPLHVVVLCPRREVIAQRESARRKTGYSATSIEDLHEVFKRTPRVGMWLDNSDQTVEETTNTVLERLASARIS